MYGKLGGPTLPEVVINLTIVSGVLDVDEDQTPACALIMDYHFKQMVDKRRQVLFDNIEINLSLLDANQGHYSQLYPELMHMVPGPPWRKTTGNLQIDPSTKFFYRNTLSDTVPLTAGLGTGHWKPDVIDKKNIWTCSGQAHLSQESGIESLSGTISHKPIRDKPLPGTGPGSVFPRDSNTAYWVLKNTSKQDTLRFLRTGLLIKSNLAMRIHMLINIKAGIAREYQTGRLINFYSGAGRLVGSHDDRGILDIPGTLEDLISFKGSTPEVFNPEGGLDLIDHMHLHLRKINLLNLTGVAEESIELEEKGVEPGSMGVEASDHWKEETLSLAFKVHKTLDIFLQEPLPTSQLEISPELVEWENPTMFGQFTATLEDLQNVWGPSGESDESEVSHLQCLNL